MLLSFVPEVPGSTLGRDNKSVVCLIDTVSRNVPGAAERKHERPQSV
jgi:hypothetical protein